MKEKIIGPAIALASLCVNVGMYSLHHSTWALVSGVWCAGCFLFCLALLR